MTTTPRPGWYPDPADDAGYRWWDGESWTDETADHAYAPSPGEVVPAGASRGPSRLVRAVAWTLVVALVLTTAAGAVVLIWPNPQAGTSGSPETTEATEATSGGQLDERARRASIGPVTMDLPPRPYKVSGSAHKVPGVLDVVFLAEAALHPRTEQHKGWSAMTCLALVHDGLADGLDLDEDSFTVVKKLATRIYGAAGPTAITDIDSAQYSVDGHPGVRVTARVHYAISGLPSRYDDVTAVLVGLDDGSVVVALSSVPDDASDEVRRLAAESLESLRVG